MNRFETLKMLDKACEEVVALIHKAEERGEFNELYFEQPFKEWFAKELDKMR